MRDVRSRRDARAEIQSARARVQELDEAIDAGELGRTAGEYASLLAGLEASGERSIILVEIGVDLANVQLRLGQVRECQRTIGRIRRWYVNRRLTLRLSSAVLEVRSNMLSVLGHTYAAYRCAERAVRVLRAESRLHPNAPHHELAAGLMNLGNRLCDLDRYSESQELFEEAVVLLGRALGRGDLKPAIQRDISQTLADCLYNIAVHELNVGNGKQANAAMIRVRGVLEKYGRRPDFAWDEISTLVGLLSSDLAAGEGREIEAAEISRSMIPALERLCAVAPEQYVPRLFDELNFISDVYRDSAMVSEAAEFHHDVERISAEYGDLS